MSSPPHFSLFIFMFSFALPGVGYLPVWRCQGTYSSAAAVVVLWFLMPNFTFPPWSAYLWPALLPPQVHRYATFHSHHQRKQAPGELLSSLNFSNSHIRIYPSLPPETHPFPHHPTPAQTSNHTKHPLPLSIKFTSEKARWTLCLLPTCVGPVLLFM